MLHRNSVRMTKPQMEKVIKDYMLESYHVLAYDNGGYELLYGDDDPLKLLCEAEKHIAALEPQVKRLREAELEIETMKVQIRYLMTELYGIDYTTAEELVK